MLKRGCVHFALQKRCIIRYINSYQHHFLILRELCSIFFLHVLQVVSDEAYKSWSVNRQRALAAIDNREELVMETTVQLETNLSLLGNIHQPDTHRPLKHLKSILFDKFCAWVMPDFGYVSSCRGDGHWGPSTGECPRHHRGTAGGRDPGVGADWWQAGDSCQHWLCLQATGRGRPGD